VITTLYCASTTAFKAFGTKGAASMREVYKWVAISITGYYVFGAGFQAVIALVTFFEKQCFTLRPGWSDIMHPVSDISA
jgi:hypothetical protein